MKAVVCSTRRPVRTSLLSIFAVVLAVFMSFDLAAAQVEEATEEIEEAVVTPDEELTPCGAPIFAPPGGDFGVATAVDVIALIDNAQIHYSLDQTEPTKYSPIWDGKLFLEERGTSTVLKVMVYKPGFCSPGATVTMTYNILDECAEVEFNPPGGSYQDEAKVTMSSRNCPQANIYFTMDGTTPTPDMSNPSTLILVDGYFVVDQLGYTTLTAVASSEGWMPSPAADSTIHVFPRPPLPAFEKRDRETMLSEMDKAFSHVTSEVEHNGYLRPPHFLRFVHRSLNPDEGRCPGCEISVEEGDLIEARTVEHMKLHGLHVDDSIKLHHGFLLRGDMFTFVHNLNAEMGAFRERKEHEEDVARRTTANSAEEL